MFKRPHSRLGTVLKRLHKRLGPAGMVLSVLALIIALAGVAFAAGGLTKQQEKQVIKIAKKYAGKNGATGPAGPAGPAGANGKDGAQGPQGKEGAKGATGPQGVAGPQGPEGSPWTAGGVLPAGKTETGTWGLTELAKAPGFLGVKIPISFTIPLAAPITEATKIHVFEGETIPTGCTGTVSEGKVLKLGADPGNFCVHITTAVKLTAAQIVSFNPETFFINQTGTAGATLVTAPGTEEGATAAGTWAVTAEE
jgi:collagen triple helix repeat protein